MSTSNKSSILLPNKLTSCRSMPCLPTYFSKYGEIDFDDISSNNDVSPVTKDDMKSENPSPKTSRTQNNGENLIQGSSSTPSSRFSMKSSTLAPNTLGSISRSSCFDVLTSLRRIKSTSFLLSYLSQDTSSPVMDQIQSKPSEGHSETNDGEQDVKNDQNEGSNTQMEGESSDARNPRRNRRKKKQYNRGSSHGNTSQETGQSSNETSNQATSQSSSQQTTQPTTQVSNQQSSNLTNQQTTQVSIQPTNRQTNRRTRQQNRRPRSSQQRGQPSNQPTHQQHRWPTSNPNNNTNYFGAHPYQGTAQGNTQGGNMQQWNTFYNNDGSSSQQSFYVDPRIVSGGSRSADVTNHNSAQNYMGNTCPAGPRFVPQVAAPNMSYPHPGVGSTSPTQYGHQQVYWYPVPVYYTQYQYVPVAVQPQNWSSEWMNSTYNYGAASPVVYNTNNTSQFSDNTHFTNSQPVSNYPTVATQHSTYHHQFNNIATNPIQTTQLTEQQRQFHHSIINSIAQLIGQIHLYGIFAILLNLGTVLTNQSTQHQTQRNESMCNKPTLNQRSSGGQQTDGSKLPSSFPVVQRSLPSMSQTPDLAQIAHRVHAFNTPRLLIILDVYGSVVDRAPKGQSPPFLWRQAVRRKQVKPSRIGAQFLWVRPYLRQFFHLIYRRHAIGIWSCSTKKNVDPILKLVSSKLPLKETSIYDRLSFVWDREQTVPDPDRAHHATIKPLKRVWCQNPAKDHFSYHNTLIADDTLCKIRHAESGGIVIPTFLGKTRRTGAVETDDHLLWLMLYIEYLSMEAEKHEDGYSITAVREKCMDLQQFTDFGKLHGRSLTPGGRVNHYRSTAMALIEKYRPPNSSLADDELNWDQEADETAVYNEDYTLLINLKGFRKEIS